MFFFYIEKQLYTTAFLGRERARERERERERKRAECSAGFILDFAQSIRPTQPCSDVHSALSVHCPVNYFAFCYCLSDRDECADLSHNCRCVTPTTVFTCMQSCTNTVGSYSCGCSAGFALDASGQLCIGEYSVRCLTLNVLAGTPQ